jgi:crotonobetainyl-CoA:carnitine CoA-transferase CaiB-like acyl-CoA transferase
MEKATVELLAGYCALDLTDLKGQLCGKLLRDLGMEVIKIEPPGGDPVRRLGPFAHDQPHLEGSLRFAYLNAGKKSLTLDLTHPEGRALLLRLVEQADVLLESFAPGELDRLGLGPAVLRARNPRLVITSVTGFGQSGPYRDYLCPDLVAFAMGGLMYISGDPALPPVKAPETQAFYYASVCAALGTLLALWHRAQGGEGCGVDIAAQEAIATHEHLIRAFGFDGHSIRRHGSQHAYVAPANIFPTRDGYVYLFVSRPHWPLLLALWPDHPPELDDPKWEPNEARRAQADWINEQLAQFTRQFTKEELTRLMQEHGVPCLPVNTPAEFMRDEQVRYRELFRPAAHPVLGEYVQVAFPVLLDGARLPPAPPPLLGQHTRELLTDRLGLSPTEVELLFAQGIV